MTCIHCHQPIHESDDKWFHDHNLVTFCMGFAFERNADGSIGAKSEKASPPMTS